MAQVLPEYLSEWTTKRSEAEGVICMPETAVHDCQLNEDRLELILSDGQIVSFFFPLKEISMKNQFSSIN